MSEVCAKCGLPKELCVCGAISKGESRIKVYVDSRRYGKNVTIVEQIEKKNIREVSKQLKSKLACGGTVKDGKIELQGNHKAKVKEILVRLGFPADKIEVE